MHGRLRARPGALVARRRAARLQRPPAGAGLAALRRRSWRARSGGCRPSPTPGSTRIINGPEAFTPGQRVHPRRERGPRLLRGGRVLRPRHRRRRRRSGRQMATLDRRRRAGARPLEDGHPPVRRRSTARSALHARAHHENYATYYDIHYPNEERQAGRPLRTRPDLRAAGGARARSSARSRAGSGPNWFEPNATPARRDEALRPRGWAGPALVARDRRGGARHAAGRRRCSTRPRFAKIEIAGPGALGLPPAAVRQRHRPTGRLDHLHPAARPPRRDRVRLHRHAHWPRTRFLLVTGHGLRQPRRRAGSGRTLPDDGTRGASAT